MLRPIGKRRKGNAERERRKGDIPAYLRLSERRKGDIPAYLRLSASRIPGPEHSESGRCGVPIRCYTGTSPCHF